jgi:queuine tRNA-ribosyltransferase
VSESAEFEVVTTRGGARAMFDVAAGEVMHPHGGPRAEAEHLYVSPSHLAARLAESSAHEPLVLLDVGLGAGSNAIAALRASTSLSEAARPLEIVSFDRTLAALAKALEPEHAEAFDLTGIAAVAAREVLERGAFAARRIRWRMVLGPLPDTLAQEPAACADIVYWDPFSPRTNKALWGVRTFAALRRLCRSGATVHTYSGATSTRAALLLAGFAVGLGGTTREDRTATCAAVDVADLERPLDRRWLERLSRSSSPFPEDAPEEAMARIAAMPQFAP